MSGRTLMVCGLWLLWSAPTWAQTPPRTADEQAHVLFLNGQRLYEEGRYEEAIVAFQTAYDLSKRPLMLYNIANAHERLGQLEQAIAALNQYRVFADPSEQDVLLARVQTLEKRLAAQRAAVPAPLPVPAPVQPAPVLPAPVPGGPVPQRRSLAPWVVTVGGTAVALAGTTVAGLTWSRSRGLLEEGDEQGWQRLRPVNNAAVVSGIAGGVVGTVGLTWVVLRGPAD